MFLPLARAPVSHSTYRAPGRRPTYSNVLQNMRGLAALAVIDGDLRSCPSHPDGFTFSSPGRIRTPDGLHATPGALFSGGRRFAPLNVCGSRFSRSPLRTSRTIPHIHQTPRTSPSTRSPVKTSIGFARYTRRAPPLVRSPVKTSRRRRDRRRDPHLGPNVSRPGKCFLFSTFARLYARRERKCG